MLTFSVSLKSIADVKRFVDAASHCPCEVDVISGRYVINAKSIMGLFSLDLAKPVQVEFHGDDAAAGAFQEEIAPFLAQAAE